MANLQWLRYDWALFVTNLLQNVTTDYLYANSCEIGHAFDVIVSTSKLHENQWIWFCSFKVERGASTNSCDNRLSPANVIFVEH